MKTNRFFAVFVSVVMGACGLAIWWFSSSRSPEVAKAPLTTTKNLAKNKASQRISPTSVLDKSPPTCPARSERWKMRVEDRLELLERLGCVPADGDVSDYNIAQKTTWWGHRLDPVTFWSNRVVWLDERNVSDANRMGREYPPIPFVDPRFADRDDSIDVDNKAASAEGPTIRLHQTDRENAFWNMFVVTQPRPPADLSKRQFEEAERMLKSSFDFEHRGNPGGLTQESLAEIQNHWGQQAKDAGYPTEAFSMESLRLAYMNRMRTEYQDALTAQGNGNSLPMRQFQRRLCVPIEDLKQPMTESDRNAIDAWKIAYLRRLRAQKTDESYISAYLQAWNLDAKTVFKEPGLAENP